MENVYYVGMDVHKETVQISIFRDFDREPEFEIQLENNEKKILELLEKYQNKGVVRACYEAGCMGFTLKRFLEASHLECHVIAPGKIPRKPGDRIKTDRRDARNLAKLLRTKEAVIIHVPTVDDEATRDYIRARDDAKLELKRIKQQILKFFLRLGYTYDGIRYWTARHRKWMKEITFAHPVHKETFESYYIRLGELEEHLFHMEGRIVELSQSERYKEKVDKLRCFKGVDYLIALAITCEIGDFRRFRDAGSFMAYLGLVPREHSSGEKRWQGGITKTGNTHLRRLLIEASWHYRYQQAPSRRLSLRRTGQKTEVIAYADKALRRLQKKFIKMVFRGKSKKVAVTAVAREFSGFIWGMMTETLEG
jgi:transposase